MFYFAAVSGTFFFTKYFQTLLLVYSSFIWLWILNTSSLSLSRAAVIYPGDIPYVGPEDNNITLERSSVANAFLHLAMYHILPRLAPLPKSAAKNK